MKVRCQMLGCGRIEEKSGDGDRRRLKLDQARATDFEVPTPCLISVLLHLAQHISTSARAISDPPTRAAAANLIFILMPAYVAGLLQAYWSLTDDISRWKREDSRRQRRHQFSFENAL